MTNVYIVIEKLLFFSFILSCSMKRIHRSRCWNVLVHYSSNSRRKRWSCQVFLTQIGSFQLSEDCLTSTQSSSTVFKHRKGCLDSSRSNSINHLIRDRLNEQYQPLRLGSTLCVRRVERLVTCSNRFPEMNGFILHTSLQAFPFD